MNTKSALDGAYVSRDRRTYAGYNAGFTLTELLISMVVMMILSSIALGSYRMFTLEARRTSALSALSDAASRQEQFFLNNRSYTTAIDSSGINIAATTDGGYYQLGVVAATASCPVSRCWVMQATPQGGQTEDSCGTLSYNSDGEKLPSNCW